MLIATAALAGCGTKEAPLPIPVPVPQAEATPRVLTSLSALDSESPSATPAAAPSPAAAVATPGAGPSVQAQASPGAQANVSRLFTENPAGGSFGGTAAAPGEKRLLNAKAAQFSAFSRNLLDQLFVAAQDLERTELANQVLSINIQPVVISATMSKEGKLVQLLLEKHSGSGAVDQLMVKACERGLWAVNPPPAAVGSDGNYHVRVEALLKNFNRTTQANVWNFQTDLALALD